MSELDNEKQKSTIFDAMRTSILLNYYYKKNPPAPLESDENQPILSQAGKKSLPFWENAFKLITAKYPLSHDWKKGKIDYVDFFTQANSKYRSQRGKNRQRNLNAFIDAYEANRRENQCLLSSLFESLLKNAGFF